MPGEKTIVDNNEDYVVSVYHFTGFSLQESAWRGDE
jgi:hypothetical protein